MPSRPDTVIVLYAGSPVAMPWNAQAKAVLWSYYAGMEGGTAIAEILFGKENPSGRLAESFPKDANDCPAHTIGTFAKKDVVEYKEGRDGGMPLLRHCGYTVILWLWTWAFLQPFCL
ncbi:MAG: glycoside hydrolase family 3 protein [Roseburia sp.]